jgi:hypothetical protein
MTVKAMKSGAVEFLTKPFRDQDLIDAIHQALKNNAEARQQQHEIAQLQERYAKLTVREREVMRLIVSGMLTKQIASTSMRSTIDRNWCYELRSMPRPASLARACTQFSCSCLKHLRKTTCVICNLCAAPKVDIASRRYFDAAHLVRGSREKAWITWITCSKLDKKIRLMTRQYSSSRSTEALQPFTHSPLAAANLVAVVKLITVVLLAKAEPKHRQR